MSWPPPEDQDALPETLAVPLFPLPRTVLFPAVKLPFYVFEPRYRAMLSDVLDGAGLVGIPQVLPGFESALAGSPPFARVLGIGHVANYVTHRDGTSHIEVTGRFRARILEELPEGAYRRARVGILDDPDADQEGATSLLEQLSARVRALIDASGPQQARDPIEHLLDGTGHSLTVLVNTLSTVLIADSRTRQALLELPGVEQRARRLATEIDDMRRTLLAKAAGDPGDDKKEPR